MSTGLRKDAGVVFSPHLPKHKHTRDTTYTHKHTLTPDSTNVRSARCGQENRGGGSRSGDAAQRLGSYPSPAPSSLCVLGELANVSVHSELDNMVPLAQRKPSVDARCQP